MKKIKIRLIIYHFIILTILLLLLTENYIHNTFGSLDLKQLLFHVEIPIGKASGNFFNMGFNSVIPKFLLIGALYLLILFIFSRLKFNINIKLLKNKISFSLNEKLNKLKWLFLLILMICHLIVLNNYFHIFNTIRNQFAKTEIYENYYIEPTTVDISMPENKRNLIYIYIESLESSDLSLENGGYRAKSIIPEIENLAKENINFSQHDKIGGFNQISGTGYTVGALIGQTAGLPLIPLITMNPEEANYQNLKDGVLTNAYSIGEVLQDNGYKNYFMFGSDKKFADRAGYLESHGDYDIFDFESAKEYKYIPEDYNIKWWGFEDKKLYEYAKTKLKEISKNEEPFNFSLLTVDTHPYGGYLDEECKVSQSLNKYENVYSCASKMLSDFIKWIKKQSFYKNTTIVIAGDHLNMVLDDLHEEMPEDYERTILNIFMNSSVKTDCSKNRDFTTFDMYPTTLASLGATIEGNRLGFGTNLFSCKETLSEELGLDYFKEELEKNSSYYKLCLLNDLCKKDSN